MLAAKVCSKALCNRIIDLIPKLVNPNQAGSVKGRHIDESQFIRDAFDMNHILFAADFRKAFDSIEQNFVYSSSSLWIWRKFYILIKTMFNNSKSSVLNMAMQQIRSHYKKERNAK